MKNVKEIVLPKDYGDLLYKLSKKYPCTDELCGGPCDIVERCDNQLVVYCSDSSDGYCEGFLTEKELLEVSQYFKEVADLLHNANLDFKRGVYNG